MATLADLKETWDLCEPLYEGETPSLLVENHVHYLIKLLGDLPAGFISLDASRAWTVYWPLNGLSLMRVPTNDIHDRVASSVLAYQHPDGGFGGGVGQPGHLASTYAAVLALAYCGPEAWSKINRPKMLEFLLARKDKSGGFSVCKHGEIDPRGTYTALCVASLLEILTPELLRGVGDYIRSCQSYEGGFANMPNGEAHGGYAFCALGSLFLAGDLDFDLGKFVTWLGHRQNEHGGLSGRTNKLVDGCYSHWVGNCWLLVQQLAPQLDIEQPMSQLKEYILRCCQDSKGGLRDKPECRPDAYHSNYVLLGLAGTEYKYKMTSPYEWEVEGESLVKPINPLLGLPLGVGEAMRAWSVQQEKVQ